MRAGPLICTSLIVAVSLLLNSPVSANYAPSAIYPGPPLLSSASGNFSLLITLRDFRGCQKNINQPTSVWPQIPPATYPTVRCSRGADTQPGTSNCTVNTGGVPELIQDFEGWPGDCNIPTYQFGVTAATLNATDGTPMWNTSNSDWSMCMFTTADNFYKWYHDAPGYNTELTSYALFYQTNADPTPTVVGPTVDWSPVWVWDEWSEPYFPIDGQGFGNYCWYGSIPPAPDDTRLECLWQIDSEVLGVASNGSCTPPVFQHNFHFTDFIHVDFLFQISNPPKFKITGDDDTWVYINGIRVLDGGGVNWESELTFVINTTQQYQQLGLQDGQIARMSWFHAQRKVDCSHHMIVTTIQPICPVEANGKQCASNLPTDDGCSQWQCVNNTCQQVKLYDCSNTAVPSSCYRPICNADGSCSVGANPFTVNATCVPGPGEQSLPCAYYFCAASGQCVPSTDTNMTGQNCTPSSSQLQQYSAACGNFICAGDGSCEFEANPNAVNTTCVPPQQATPPSGSSASCQQYVCGTGGTCVISPLEVAVNASCVPSTGSSTLPCHKYTCQQDFGGQYSCQASIDTSLVGQTCKPQNQTLDQCQTATCNAAGVCVLSPNTKTINAICTPQPGEQLSDCFYYICSSNGTCTQRVLNTSMVGKSCVPPFAANLTKQNLTCSLYTCLGNGQCVFTGTNKNVSSCIHKGLGVGAIVGIAVGVVAALVLVAAILAVLFLAGGPGVFASVIGGSAPAAAKLDINPLYADRVMQSPCYGRQD